MSKKSDVLRKTSVGGQALIEGVMMTGPKGTTMSVRKTDGTIISEDVPTKHLKDKCRVFGWPMIRGIVSFIESMTLGYKTLMRSAELSGQLDAEEETENMSKADKWLNDHMGPKLFGVITAVASVLAMVLCFGLFMFLPSFLVKLADDKLLGLKLYEYNLRPLCEGIIRSVIMVLYMLIISKMKDIKRVFMYHGAEHKTICCYEKGLDLTVENVKPCRRFHPRCGTSFIFVILIVSIIISSVVYIFLNNPLRLADRTWLWVILKIFCILPIVTSLSYEFIKYAGRHENLFTKILSAPGLWMQRITTSEPDDGMIECAIASIKAVITENPEDDTL